MVAKHCYWFMWLMTSFGDVSNRVLLGDVLQLKMADISQL